MKYGFGIVGCGMIARFHARAIADLPNARLVGCYNRGWEKTEEFAREHRCTAYRALSEMVADPSIHVVTICTPSGAHLEPALDAAAAGKHVIVEKPLEVTVERCDQLIDACQRHGVTLSTIFPSRFHESARLMKQAVEAGRFGRMTLGDAYVKWYRPQKYYDSGAWRGTWELDGGGALMNQAIHSVDLLLWFMGQVSEVSALVATLAHERIEVEDVAVATLRFASGALGVIEATTAAYPGYLKRIELHGTGGSAVLEEEDIKVWDFAESLPEDEPLRARMRGRTATGGGAADPAAIGHHGHAAQFRGVLDAIARGGGLPIDGSEGRKSVELIRAIYTAATTGSTVHLP